MVPVMSGIREPECRTCENWRTIVTSDNQHVPCPDCGPPQRTVPQIPEVGDLVAVVSLSQLCQVELPVQMGMDGGMPVIFVRSVAGGDAWWANLADVQVVGQGAEA